MPIESFSQNALSGYVYQTQTQWGGRNLLHNGAMHVAQRGTGPIAFTMNNTPDYFTADRWRADTTFAEWTQSVVADGPGSGLTKSLKILCTTSGTPTDWDFTLLSQRMEAKNLQGIAKGTADAKQLTLSFWVKSNVTGTYIVELYDNENDHHVCSTYTINSSATWEYKTIVLPADTDVTATLPFDTAVSWGLDVEFHLSDGAGFGTQSLQTVWANFDSGTNGAGQTNLAAATNNYWQITGVQLEIGPVATPFEFKSYADDLRQCQRYYWRAVQGTGFHITNGYYYSNTQLQGYIKFPVTMRTAPSIDSPNATDYFVSSRNGGTDTFNSLSIDGATPDGALIYNNTQISGTAGQAGSIATNNAAAYLGFTADL